MHLSLSSNLLCSLVFPFLLVFIGYYSLFLKEKETSWTREKTVYKDREETESLYWLKNEIPFGFVLVWDSNEAKRRLSVLPQGSRTFLSVCFKALPD
jgi:hypothetical protein